MAYRELRPEPRQIIQPGVAFRAVAVECRDRPRAGQHFDTHEPQDHSLDDTKRYFRVLTAFRLRVGEKEDRSSGRVPIALSVEEIRQIRGGLDIPAVGGEMFDRLAASGGVLEGAEQGE